MARFSKLDAVNVILRCVGESPVSSLSSGLPDAAEAEAWFDDTSRDIQESGWNCNKGTEVTLTRSATSGEVDYIPLPSNCLRVDTSGTDETINVTERDGYLFNLDDQTYVFDDDVVVDIVYELEFDELPYRLAYYIAWSAGGRYQMSAMGSTTIESWIQREIDQAKAKLDASEDDVDDANVLRDSASVARVTYRNNTLYGAR